MDVDSAKAASQFLAPSPARSDNEDDETTSDEIFFVGPIALPVIEQFVRQFGVHEARRRIPLADRPKIPAALRAAIAELEGLLAEAEQTTH